MTVLKVLSRDLGCGGLLALAGVGNFGRGPHQENSGTGDPPPDPSSTRADRIGKAQASLRGDPMRFFFLISKRRAVTRTAFRSGVLLPGSEGKVPDAAAHAAVDVHFIAKKIPALQVASAEFALFVFFVAGPHAGNPALDLGPIRERGDQFRDGDRLIRDGISGIRHFDRSISRAAGLNEYQPAFAGSLPARVRYATLGKAAPAPRELCS